MKCSSFKSMVLLLFIVISFSSLTAQTDWTIYPHNPVFPGGNHESWEMTQEWSYVFHDGNQYVMYYGGGPSVTTILEAIEIGRATSEDGYIWTKYGENPVLTFGPTGAWDDMMIDPGPVIFDGEEYRMWYSGFDGVDWRIGLATSTDGVDWTKYEENPVLDLGDTDQWDDQSLRVGNVIYDQSQYKMWYTGTDGEHLRVGYATSPDGVNWTKYSENPVLDIGEPGTWDDERIDHCYVLFNGNNYEMWYQGYDEPTYWFFPTGYATSEDGITWSKYGNNPVLTSSVSSVLLEGGVYRLWSWLLGYAEDFSHIAHSDSFVLNCSYAKPTLDTLLVSAWVENPQEKSITVRALMAGQDSVLIDSTNLTDQGEGVWQGWTVPGGERICQVWIKTIDDESGTIHDGMLWDVDYFCTSGPVNVSHLEVISADTIANPDQTLQYKIYMQNNGKTATVTDVSIKIVSLDSFTTVIAFENPRYGDMAPGEVAEPHRAIRIMFRDDCPVNINSQFKVNVMTGTHTFWSDTFSVFIQEPTGISENDLNIPTVFALRQNYPNPFNPTTIINYELPTTLIVDLSIYDLLGQKVASLVNEQKQAGFHQVEFDAGQLSSGVYYYMIKTGGFVDVKKMILLR